MFKVIRTILALTLLLPSVGYSLGLGDIKLHSALSQPMNAEIELLSVSAKDAKSLNVALGSAETFARVGIERPDALLSLRFALAQRADSSYYIKITSVQGIREPFLDFLVEVSWQSGRMLREYTVLLDPPELARQTQAPVIEAPQADVIIEDYSINELGADDAVYKYMMGSPNEPMADEPGAFTPDQVPQDSSQQAMATRYRTPSGGLNYGPVQKNETLWRIAEKMQLDEASNTQQVMMALLRNNPEAFYDNNVNRLKAGAILRIDDPSMIAAMSRTAAIREISRQTRSWQDYKRQAAVKAGRVPATEQVADSGMSAAMSDEPQLKLMAPASDEKGTETASASAEDMATLARLRQEMMLVTENEEATRSENSELKTRLQGLESQLASMQRLLSLKDDDLAAMQRQAKDAGIQVPESTADIAEAEQQAELAREAALGEVAAVAAIDVTDTGKEAVPAELEVEAKPAAKAPKAIPAPIEPESFLDSFLGDFLEDPVMAGGGIAFVLILLLLMVMIIRRRKGIGEFRESILTAGSSSMLTGESKDDSDETFFMSDFAISGMGDIETEDTEVDALTEADVYLAYGRHQQAEELLKDAIKATPNRHELLVKLLELYKKSDNRDAFEEIANQAFAATSGTGDHWDQILVMGHEFLPENPMFADAPEGVSSAEGSAAGDALSSVDEVMDIGLDAGSLGGEAAADDFDMDLGVDFSDLDDIGSSAKPPSESSPVELIEEPAATTTSADDELLSLDLGELDLDMDSISSETVSPAIEDTVAETEVDAGLDFDLSDMGLDLEDSSETETVDETAPAVELDLSDLSLEDDTAEELSSAGLELDDLTFETDSSAVETPAEEFDLSELSLDADTTDELPMLELELDDLSLENDTTSIETPEELDLADLELDTSAVSDIVNAEETVGATTPLTDDDMFADLDEIGTKLDLAKAYADMGDADGARNILEEVLSDGNDQQKQQAQQLMEGIA